MQQAKSFTLFLFQHQQRHSPRSQTIAEDDWPAACSKCRRIRKAEKWARQGPVDTIHRVLPYDIRNDLLRKPARADVHPDNARRLDL